MMDCSNLTIADLLYGQCYLSNRLEIVIWLGWAMIVMIIAFGIWMYFASREKIR